MTFQADIKEMKQTNTQANGRTNIKMSNKKVSYLSSVGVVVERPEGVQEGDILGQVGQQPEPGESSVVQEVRSSGR